MISVSYGILEKNDNLNFNFYCSIGANSIGSPILNLSNNKLIGIYKENKNLNYNAGIILKNIIEEFIKNVKIVTPNKTNLNENKNNFFPDIKETNLGPETGEDESDGVEISNKNKDIKDFINIKETILGPEDYDDEEETNDQNTNVKSTTLSESNDINYNNLNTNNYNKTNEKFNNNNLKNIFNSNSDGSQIKSKITFNENLNINNELNKKSNNSEQNNNDNNIGSMNINKKNENLNYFSNKQIPRMTLNTKPGPETEENEGYISSNEIYGMNLNNNNINNNDIKTNTNNNNINNNVNNNNNININMSRSMNFGNNQINSMEKTNLNNNEKDLYVTDFEKANNLNIGNNSSKNLINKSSVIQKFSFSIYKKVSKTGLKDLGNTSYLNSTLQLLGSIQNLASFFLNPNNVIDANVSLSFFIKRLYLHFYPYPENDIQEIYEPKYLLTFLIERFGKIDNPINLIKMILNTLHGELNKCNKNIIKMNPNKFNKNELIRDEIENFRNFNHSQIFNIFNWFEIKESQCLVCNKTSYEFNTNNIFDLDIWKSFNFHKKNCITIYDCLAFSRFAKKEQYYCENCKNFKNKVNFSKIYSSPNVFIFSLDRGNMEQNLLNVRFFIQEKINLVEYIESKIGPSNYELKGIVSIYMNKQRYISCCKSPVDQQWYYYENEIVQKVDFNVVITNHNNNNFIPCLLVYNKRINK